MGKPFPVCADFFNCSLPRNLQSASHMRIYHNPRPKVIRNLVPGGPPIIIHRDPRRNMQFPCPHPECEHASMLNTGPYQHQKHCTFVKRDLERTTRAADDTAASPQSTRAKQQIQHHQHHRELLAPTENPVSATALGQILTSMGHLIDTMDRFDKQLAKNSKVVDGINEQMEWLGDQIDEIRTQNASLEAHTESIHIDLEMAKDHLKGLWEDNRRLKEELEGFQSDVEQVDMLVEDLGHQDVIDLD